MMRTPEMGELIQLFTERLENETDYDFMLSEINPYKDEKGQTTSKDKAVTYSLTKRAKKYIKDPDIKVPQRGKVTSKGKVSSSFGMNTGSPEKQCGRLTIDGDKKPKTRSCKNYPKNYGSVKEEEVLLASPETGLGDELENQTTIHPNRKLKPRKKGIRIKIVEKNRAKKKEKEKKEQETRRQERIFPGYDTIRKLSKGIYENDEGTTEISLNEFEGIIKRFLETATEGQREIFFDSLERLGLYSKERIKSVCNRAGYKNTEEWLKFQNSLSNAQKGDLYKED